MPIRLDQIDAAPQVTSDDESRFQAWYQSRVQRLGLNPNPDDPQHFYDYRAAFRAGAEPDQAGHWPSQFKREGHPRTVVGGVNTITGQSVSSPSHISVDGEFDLSTARPVEEEFDLSTAQPAAQAPPSFGDLRIAPLGPPLKDYPATIVSLANQALLGIPKAVYEGQPAPLDSPTGARLANYGYDPQPNTRQYPEPQSLPGKLLAGTGAIAPFGLAAKGVGLATRASVPLAYRLATSALGRGVERGAVGATAGVLSNLPQPEEYAGRAAGFGAGNVVIPPVIAGVARAFQPRLNPQTIPELLKVPQSEVVNLRPKDQQTWFKIQREQLAQGLKAKGQGLKAERDVLNRELNKSAQTRALNIRERLNAHLPERSKHFRELFEIDMAGQSEVQVSDQELRAYLLTRHGKNPEVLNAVSSRLGLANESPKPSGQLTMTQAGEILEGQLPDKVRTLGQLYQQAKDFGQTLPQAVRQSLRLYNADEYMTDKTIGTLIDFLETKGVNLSNSRGFWRETTPVIDQAVSEFRPFLVSGTKTQVASSRLKKLAMGIDTDNAVYGKTLADYLGIDDLPGSLKGVVAKLDANQKAQLALRLAQPEMTGAASPLAQAQYVTGKRHEASVEKWNRVLILLRWVGGGVGAGAGATLAVSVLRRE